jgi:hypothetical protein
MRSGLIRLSEATPAAVKRYLLGRHMPPEIIDWKYFDDRFNCGRERGLVLVRDDEVAGFLGLIPFHAEREGFEAECAWLCDWSIDPSQGGGMGLMLLKRACGLYDGLFNVGGNENTRQIVPRLADSTVPDAAINLVLPLRLGSVFARLPGGFVKRALSEQTFLQQIPLRWVRLSRDPKISIEPGLSARVTSLVEKRAGDGWRPRYDSAFVDWQLGRCPAITCWSCYNSSESPSRTGALIWKSRSSKGFWRLAFCGPTDDLEQVSVLVRAIASFVYEQRGIALFAIASHLESDLIRVLGQRGFLRRRNRLPFHVMRGRKPDLPTDEFAALSFLDTDMAYRFDLETTALGA